MFVFKGDSVSRILLKSYGHVVEQHLLCITTQYFLAR